jgi:hypothetical protein
MASFAQNEPKENQAGVQKMGSFCHFCFFRGLPPATSPATPKISVAPIRAVAEATLAALCGTRHIRRAPYRIT